MEDTLNEEVLAGGATSPLEGLPASRVAPHTVDGPPGALQEVLEASRKSSEVPPAIRVWNLDLSPGTRYRLGLREKRKQRERRRPEHYATRRARERAKYWAYRRRGVLIRYRAEKDSVDARWHFYRNYVKRKGRRWDISLEDWERMVGWVREKYYVRLVDPSRKVYDLNNVIIEGRETGELFYQPGDLDCTPREGES